MSDQPAYLIRAGEVLALPAIHFRHPLNPHSEIELCTLTARAGADVTFP